VDRAKVLIVSDEPQFAAAVSAGWQSERNSPSFLVNSSNSCGSHVPVFDLAILGPCLEPVPSVLERLRRQAKPVIHVSSLNGRSAKPPGVVNIHQSDGWPELTQLIAKQLLERQRSQAEISRLAESKSQLEREASLGRYILEARHNLNNALTSILGNSELMLLEPETFSPTVRQQLETIRNMGMRMNEIMQRFSSLQKEMLLAEQQKLSRASKAASASA